MECELHLNHHGLALGPFPGESVCNAIHELLRSQSNLAFHTQYILKTNESTHPGAGEMAQQPAVLAAPAQDPGFYLEPTWWHTRAYNFSYRGAWVLFWPPWALGIQVVHRNTRRQNTYTHKVKYLKKQMHVHTETCFL